MNVKAFCISWRDFPSHLGSTFQDLQSEGTFTDVTLVSDDQAQIQAHKIVLSASSRVLKTILLNNPHSHPLIYLKGFKKKELQSLLQFMYLGETNINQDSINEFMEKARDLEVKDLIRDAESDNEYKDGSGDAQSIDHSDSYLDEQIDSPFKDVSNIVEHDDDDLNSFDVDDIKLSPYNDSLDKSKRSNDGKKQYSCDKCEYWTTYKQLLQRHQMNKHEGVSYPCNECDLKYADPRTLKMHQSTKHQGVMYECDQCSYSASRPDSLRYHKTAIHNEGIKYPCDKCSYQGSRKSVLKIHQQVKHEGLTYYCNLCDFKSLRQKHLRVHQKSKHEGVNYFCEKCEYHTSFQSSLSAHKKNKHLTQ